MRFSDAKRVLLAIVLSTVGCVESAGSDGDACAEAAEAIESCGSEVPDELLVCEGDADATAEALLDQVDGAGCAALGDGKSDGFLCTVFGICGPDPLGPEPDTDISTRFPILLAHGFNTSTTNFWRFNDVDVALEQMDGGRQVARLGSVPPFDTPQVRGAVLAEQLEALLLETSAQKVNLVCFSQGGLDCRHLASPGGLNLGHKVASLTTISSPHRGSGMADAAVGFLPDADDAEVIDALASLWGGTFSDMAEDSHVVAALTSMSEREAPKFNAENPDHPDVYYSSWAGFSNVGGIVNPRHSPQDVCKDENGTVKILWNEKRDRMDALLVGAAAFVAHGTELLPNDGVSTVESSKWGEFHGCIPADHLDQVGQINDDPSDQRTGFDYIRFYRNIANDLARRGY